MTTPAESQLFITLTACLRRLYGKSAVELCSRLSYGFCFCSKPYGNRTATLRRPYDNRSTVRSPYDFRTIFYCRKCTFLFITLLKLFTEGQNSRKAELETSLYDSHLCQLPEYVVWSHNILRSHLGCEMPGVLHTACSGHSNILRSHLGCEMPGVLHTACSSHTFGPTCEEAPSGSLIYRFFYGWYFFYRLVPINLT